MGSAFVLLSACATPPKPAEPDVQSAETTVTKPTPGLDPRALLREALDEEDPRLRAEKLEKAYDVFEHEPATQEQLSIQIVQLYAQLHDLDKMRHWAKLVSVRDTTGYAQVLNAMAYAYSELGTSLDEAQIRIEQALDILDRLEERLHRSRGQRRALRALDSHRGAFLDTLAWIQYRDGDLEGALINLRASLEFVNDSEIRLHLGEVLAKQGKQDAAAQAYAEAAAMDGRMSDQAAEDLGKLLGSTDEAGALIAQAKDVRQAEHRKQILASAVDEPLPQFELSSLDGDTLDTSGIGLGEVAVVWFWATWCKPCLEELPILERLHGPYKDQSDVRFLGINVDENPDLAIRYLEKRPSTLPMAYGDFETTLKAFGIRALPTLLVIGPKGTIRFRHKGFSPALERRLPLEIEALRSQAK